MPLPLLRSYADMLPRLQAEEAMLAVQVSAIAAGRLDEAEARALLRSWEQAAAGPDRPAQSATSGRTRLTQAQAAAVLGAAGFGLRVAGA